jgi:polygalacturonase
MKKFLKITLLLISLALATACSSATIRLPEWTKEVGAKSKPSAKLRISVTDYGAANDGKTLCTEQIQKAIDDCTAKGGGRVEFAKGVYLTGALFVKSNVELHIGKDVTLKAVNDVAAFPDMPTRVAGIEMVWPAAIINVIGQENVAITGEGTVDGDGKYLWDKYWEMRNDYTPRGLRWIVDYDCKRVRSLVVANSSNVTVEGLTFLRAGFWTVQVLYSSHCTLRNLTIRNNVGGHGPSTDGLDVDSSDRIFIEGCDIDCNDDNICLKAGRDADGLRVNRPTEYVLVRNCTTRKGASLITCGSETSGSIRHVYCLNSRAVGSSSVLRIKSAMTRGGVVEDIHVYNVTADSVGHVLNCDMNWNPTYSYSTLPKEYEGKELPDHWKVMLTKVDPEIGLPKFRNIYMSNVKVKYARTFVTCVGAENSIIQNVELNNVEAVTATAGTIRYTDGFSAKNIKLTTLNGSVVKESDNANFVWELVE